MDYAPKETKYKGYRFRSRLEARWAIFFDKLSIDWEYEFEGYTLAAGDGYLPDFYLPTFNGGLFCEVKPREGDFSKARRFCVDTKKDIWLCDGVPDFRPYIVCTVRDGVYEEYTGLPNFNQAYGENRMYGFECISPGEQIFDDYSEYDFYWQDYYINAVNSARSARFEFGESG